MNPIETSLIVFACTVAAIVFGGLLRHWLPDQHLSDQSRDTIKLATGLVASMGCAHPRTPGLVVEEFFPTTNPPS
jgi:hypothetical protein